MLDAWVRKHPDEQTTSCGPLPTGGAGVAVALCLGMTKLLTNKQVMSAVDLGCCVAIGTADYVIGHAFPGSYTSQPPADLRTCPGPDGLVHVEALTVDGATFLGLVDAAS